MVAPGDGAGVYPPLFCAEAGMVIVTLSAWSDSMVTSEIDDRSCPSPATAVTVYVSGLRERNEKCPARSVTTAAFCDGLAATTRTPANG